MLMEESKLRWWGIDMRPRGRRRIAVVLTAVLWFFALLAVESRLGAHPAICLIALVAVTALLIRISVFRTASLIKRFEDVPGPSSWEIVEGLDGWAKYRYGAESFDAAKPEQQNDLLNRHRLGKFAVPKKNRAEFDRDERETKERDAVERWTAGWIAAMLAWECGFFCWKACYHETVSTVGVMCALFMLSAFSLCLKKARVLWVEPDPRAAAGELIAIQPS